MRSVRKAIVFKEWLSIVLGVVAAIAILCSQSFTYTVSELPDEVKTELPADDDGEHHEVTTISQDAVSSVVQLTISHGLHFITNIYHNVVEVAKTWFDQKIDFNSYFKTLFRLIISPNAP